MQIVLISGSMSNYSNTKAVLQYIGGIINERNISVKVLSVKELDLALFDPDSHQEEYIQKKLEVIKNSDAIVFGSPEYHGSFTGAMKNLLDYMTINDLKGKVVGLISTAGSSRCGINTLNSLRLVLRNFHTNIINTQMTISEEEIEDLNGSVGNRIHCFVNELVSEIHMRRKNIFMND